MPEQVAEQIPEQNDVSEAEIAVARLLPGTTIEQARSELTVISERLAAQPGSHPHFSASLVR